MKTPTPEIVRHLRDASHHVRVIPDRVSRKPYITRHYLVGDPPGPGVVHPPVEQYLHKIHRSDGINDYHNHPWEWSCSTILAGSYVEWRLLPSGCAERYVRRPGDVVWIDRRTFHRIEILGDGPVWTLFVAGPRFRDWGFKNPETGQFTPHAKRLKALKPARGA